MVEGESQTKIPHLTLHHVRHTVVICPQGSYATKLWSVLATKSMECHRPLRGTSGNNNPDLPSRPNSWVEIPLRQDRALRGGRR